MHICLLVCPTHFSDGFIERPFNPQNYYENSNLTSQMKKVKFSGKCYMVTEQQGQPLTN